MTIPFLGFLKKKPKTPPPAYVAAEKAETDRLSKTVLPNATRTMGPRDSLAHGEVEARPNGRPVVSLGGGNGSMRANDLPPAVALALEPRVERTISVELADVIAQMPPGLIRGLEEADTKTPILLKASEVEKGMASGRPCISAWTVYQQVPEIFLRTLTSADQIQVQLPFKKVLDQFSKLHVRADQRAEQVVPQLETPFLQVTLEDDARFGTVTPAAQLLCGELPEPRIEPATAQALAAAQPEAAATDKFVHPPPMHFPGPKLSNGNGASLPEAKAAPAPAPVADKPKIPTPIPFSLSPKGTDAPAPERVPASSGPSVPISAPAASHAAPTRIPFKISAPAAAPQPAAEPWLTKDNFAAVTPAAVSATSAQTDSKISLPLKAILRNVLPLQLTREIVGVSADERIEIPFSLVEPQLASGRVSLTPEVFAQYLPEAHRELFDPTASAATVSLPLQDVLKNLPDASLRMREDQVEQELGEKFVTPFSTKAEEDAERFKTAAPAAPGATEVKAPRVRKKGPHAETGEAAAKNETSPPQPPAVAVKQAAPIAAEPSSPAAPAKAVAPTPQRTALQTALETDDELDAKAVVAHVTKMAGIKACAIMFGDGLSLAGNLPEQYEADGLCAMAPSLLQRVENHMLETKLGAFRAMTLFCAKAAVTFFMQDNLCLAAVHEQKELASDIRERLARVLLELSRKYSHSA